MKKQELKTGMLVQTRKGKIGLVMKDNCYGKNAIIFNNNSWTSLDGFNDDLIWHEESKDRNYAKTVDIVKVYVPDLPTGFLSRVNKFSTLEPVWVREESTPEYTLEELTNIVGHKFKIK